MTKTHRWRKASLVMALTAIVGLALPALGDDWRPFRGHVEEQLLEDSETFNVDNACMSCTVNAAGAGWATYLGPFTRITCASPQDGGFVGITQLTAANGDTLCAELKVEPSQGNTVHGTYTFISGTGRFSEPSGGAYFVGIITTDDSDNVHVADEFGGIIQY